MTRTQKIVEAATLFINHKGIDDYYKCIVDLQRAVNSYENIPNDSEEKAGINLFRDYLGKAQSATNHVTFAEGDDIATSLDQFEYTLNGLVQKAIDWHDAEDNYQMRCDIAARDIADNIIIDTADLDLYRTIAKTALSALRKECITMRGYME